MSCAQICMRRCVCMHVCMKEDAGATRTMASTVIACIGQQGVKQQEIVQLFRPGHVQRMQKLGELSPFRDSLHLRSLLA